MIQCYSKPNVFVIKIKTKQNDTYTVISCNVDSWLLELSPLCQDFDDPEVIGRMRIVSRGKRGSRGIQKSAAASKFSSSSKSAVGTWIDFHLKNK